MQMSFRCRWALCLTLSKLEYANYEHVSVRKIDMSKQGLVKNTIDIDIDIDIELGLFFFFNYEIEW